MAITKLAWHADRGRIMLTQEGNTCWAAAVEAVLSYYKQQSYTIDEIVRLSVAGGVAPTGEGTKGFKDVLKAVDIYGNSKKNKDGFLQTAQVFNFIKNSIDAKRPIIVGWTVVLGEEPGDMIRHAGMIFGYDDTNADGRVFIIESVKIREEANYNSYLNVARTMHEAFFAFGNLRGKITEIYLTKPPAAAAQGDGDLNPQVINRT